MELINIEKYRSLKKILKKHCNLLTEMDRDKIDKQILKAYVYDKSLTCIEIKLTDYENVLHLIKDLDKFFFVIHAPYVANPEYYGFKGDIFITRFRNVYNITKLLIDKNLEDNNGELSGGFVDKFADLFGFLFGYTPKEIA